MTTSKKNTPASGAAEPAKAQPAAKSTATNRTTANANKRIHKLNESELTNILEAELAQLSEAERVELKAVRETYTHQHSDWSLYQSKAQIKPLTLIFRNLRANSKAFLSLRDGQRAIFHAGNSQDKLSGLKFMATGNSVLDLRNFLINSRELYLQTYADCPEITIQLSIQTDLDTIKGRIDLPPDANITLQSQTDRSSLIGLSSFSIDLN